MVLMALWFGGCALASGVAMVGWPERRRKVWQARRDALKAGAPERFLEERRALEAYPVPSSDRRIRLSGLFMLVCGAALIGLALVR